MPDELTLRRTALPDASPDDWSVRHNGEIVGRIYKTPNRAQDPWFWGLSVFPSSAANSGFAADLDGAKAAFRRRWEQLRDSSS